MNRGSEWHRWDPHLHTPDTLLANRFKGDWAGFLGALENATPIVQAVGVTEYCTIEPYKRFREFQQQGRASNVLLAFPNVEFRLDVQTERKSGINVHLLFSPDDADHVEQIERVLGELSFDYRSKKYRCTPDQLRALGRAHDPTQRDDAALLRLGAEQFKLSREQLAGVVQQDAWARQNCLIAVSGREADGPAGLQNDGAFRLVREEIEAMADIIFSSSARDHEFWAGRGTLSTDQIEAKYRCLKPCLHGSDAHAVVRVAAPDEDRFCWIRGSLTFMGLKQTLLEPHLRVHIGPEAPRWAPDQEVIREVVVTGAPWLRVSTVPLNPGLVAIIGPKGSGKTALADFIGRATGVQISDGASFLAKADELLGGATVHVTWANETRGPSAPLALPQFDEAEDRLPSVRYLSQQFVERLCSSHGMSDELLREIESVVFQAVPEDERMEAATFGDLRTLRLEQVSRVRYAKIRRMSELSEAIAVDEDKKAKVESLKKALADWAAKVKEAEKAMAALLPREKKDAVARQERVQRAIRERTGRLEQLKAAESLAKALPEDVEELRLHWERDFKQLEVRNAALPLSASDWQTLRPSYSDQTANILRRVQSAIATQIRDLQSGSPGSTPDPTNVEALPLSVLRELDQALTKELGVEKDRARQYGEHQRNIAKWQREVTAAEAKVKDAEGAVERIGVAIVERRALYGAVFDLFVREKALLEELYEPLKSRLASEAEPHGQLEFYVRRTVDLERWVATGEALLDLRKAGAFQGRGALRKVAEATLLSAWSTGDAAAVGAAMDRFRQEYGQDLVTMLKPEASRRALGEWVSSTDHISLAYGIRYQGADLTKLSPGMRGIVLLMLYLAIDRWDERPLVVDQPEENLDPQSVYEQLVAYFRIAKQRRQVILVTHNPNLVVNTDADQVIVAAAVREKPDELPVITYTSGGLEDAEIRAAVCRILEGGERAFRERERRYALPQDRRTGT